MRKTSFLIIIFISFFFQFAHTQSVQKLTVNGVVCDSITGRSLSFCTVLFVEKMDSTKSHGAITNENGEYTVADLSSGDYIIQYRYVGYKTKVISKNLRQYRYNDTVFLSGNPQILKSIEVTASVFERDIDKLVMNASQIKLPEGSNALDLLKEVPGANITNDNCISLLGKDVMILIDGKPVRIPFDKLSNMLKNQSSNDIGKVEIMFNPPPKYVDQWSGAVLNIISKKKLEAGLYGTITNMSGYGKHFREEFNIDLNYRKGKFNSFINFGPRESKREKKIMVTQSSVNEKNILSFQETNNINIQNGYFLFGGISYLPNDKSSLDLNFQQYVLTDNTDLIDSIVTNNSSFLNSLILSSNNRYSLYKDHEISLFYQNKMKEDSHNFSIEGAYSKSTIKYDQKRKSNTINLNDLSIPIETVENRNSTPTQQNVCFFRVDHFIKLSKFKIESGLNCNYTQMDDNFIYENLVNNIWQNDSSKSNHFIYKENIFSGFISVGKQMTSKYSFKAALRGAYTLQSGKLHTVSNDKTNATVLPSVFMSYSFNENNEFTINYDCTLNRPNFEALNPFKYYDNPILYFEGNPNLNPAIKNKIEVIHRYKDLLTTLSYDRIDDKITLRPVLSINSDKIIGYKYENFNAVEILKLSSVYSFSILKEKLRFFLNPDMQYSIMNDPQARYNMKATNYNLYISVDYVFNKETNWILHVYSWCTSGREDGYSQTEAYYESGISMSHTFIKNKLRLNLELKDIFNSANANKKSVIDNIVYKTENRPDSRYLRIRMSYSFSSKGVKRYNKHYINNEEKSRSLLNK